MQHEQWVEAVASSRLPLKECGTFEIRFFQNKINGAETVALIREPLASNEPCLVRLHSACLTGDVFGSKRCDCGRQLEASLEYISKQGGVLLYLPQEGRGIGLINKIKAYALQDGGLDTVEANHQLGFAADQRDYSAAAQILRALGVNKIKLLTNNPSKVFGLKQCGVEVVERIALEFPPTCDNISYLRTKREKLGHLLTLNNE